MSTGPQTPPVLGLRIHGGIAHVSLRRPAASDALDLDKAEALRAATRTIIDNGQVAAVVVHGEGPRFCAGGDLAAMLASDDRLQYVHALAAELDLAFQELSALDAIVAGRCPWCCGGCGTGAHAQC